MLSGSRSFAARRAAADRRPTLDRCCCCCHPARLLQACWSSHVRGQGLLHACMEAAGATCKLAPSCCCTPPVGNPRRPVANFTRHVSGSRSLPPAARGVHLGEQVGSVAERHTASAGTSGRVLRRRRRRLLTAVSSSCAPCPPCSQRSCNTRVIINILLTLLGWIPGERESHAAAPERMPCDRRRRCPSELALQPPPSTALLCLPCVCAGIIHAVWVLMAH